MENLDDNWFSYGLRVSYFSSSSYLFFSFFSLVFNRLNSSDAYVDKHPDVWMFLGIFISNIKNAFPYIS